MENDVSIEKEGNPEEDDEINFLAYLSNSKSSWREYFETGLSTTENLKVFLKKAVKIEEIYYPLVLGYFLIPSAACSVVPILFASGQQGSGKSRLLKFGSYLYRTEILSSTSTVAAIRNQIQAGRFGWGSRYERNYCLFLDDIKEDKLKDADLFYAFLRNGYDRDTDWYKIALPEGGQLSFRIFCPKAISSVERFYAKPQFSELRRRIVLIPCHPTEDSLLPLENIDFTGFDENYLNLWNDRSRLELFASTLKESISKKPKTVSNASWLISQPLHASMVACEILEKKESLELLEEYWEIARTTIEDSSPSLSRFILQFIEEKEEEARRMNIPNIFSPASINAYLSKLKRDGTIDSFSANSVKSVLEGHGWKLIVLNREPYYEKE